MAHLYENKLIVSCQATKGEPLYGYKIMPLIANACVEGGASGIRANGIEDINTIKETLEVPVIGIIKAEYPDSEVYITPTLREVNALLNSKVDVIALDATSRQRPNAEKLADLVNYIRQNNHYVEIMADISTFEEAVEAEKLGFDYIGSTLRGYTPYTKGVTLPDIGFLEKLVSNLNTKIIAEGGIWNTEDLKSIMKIGVYAVVIGSAITRPKEITHHYILAMENQK